MLNLMKGQLLTVFFMNSLAMTSQSEIIVESETETHIIFKENKRKRKLYRHAKKNLAFIFDGHILPFSSDMKGSVMRGNACFNLVSDHPHSEIRHWIDNMTLNDVSDDDKGRILLLTESQAVDSIHDDDYSNVLYPEIKVHCAPLERAKSLNRPVNVER